MKIVFWGSSEFSLPSLKRIYETFSLEAVVTNPDSYCGRGMKELKPTCVKNFALEKGIKVLTPCNLKDESFQKELFSIDAEIYVIVSYGMIIPENIIFFPKFHSINLHASLLPKYRGPSPIQFALLNGDKITGNTVQFITKEVDKGDIILQSEVEIQPSDTYIELSQKLATEGAELLIKALNMIKEGKIERKKQDESIATYTKIINKEDGYIDFTSMSAEEIFNRWKAFILWPKIYTFYKNAENLKTDCKKTYCILTNIEVLKKKGEAGKIINADKNGLIVACKKDAIKINKIKLEGKKEMDYISFLNGYKPLVGNFF